MSRSGYVDESDDILEFGRWRGRVASAIRGRRGQALLRRLRAALDAMPRKRLIQGEFVADGEACALGSIALHERWPDAETVDSTEHDLLGERLDIASCLVKEIEYVNDDAFWTDTPASRWRTMSKWVDEHLTTESKT